LRLSAEQYSGKNRSEFKDLGILASGRGEILKKVVQVGERLGNCVRARNNTRVYDNGTRGLALVTRFKVTILAMVELAVVQLLDNIVDGRKFKEPVSG